MTEATWLVRIARAAARMHGCDCDHEVKHSKDTSGVIRVLILHDDWCSHPSQSAVRGENAQ